MSGFRYEQQKKNEFQQRAADKRAAKEKRKKDREAEAAKIQETAMEEIRIKLEKEKLIEQEKQRENKRKEEAAYKAKMEVREKAREKDPARFPPGFDDSMARLIINSADFSQPDFVEETTSTEGTVTRTALKRYVHTYEFGDDEDFYFNCWVGANIHPNSATLGGWDPGNSWILEYKKFQIKTSLSNVAIVKDLELGGTRPDVY